MSHTELRGMLIQVICGLRFAKGIEDDAEKVVPSVSMTESENRGNVGGLVGDF